LYAQHVAPAKAATAPRPTQPSHAQTDIVDWLTIPEAARHAGRAKPNGQARDSFYVAIKRELGPRKRVGRHEIDDLIERGLL
jgi:hypothetical protein